MTKKTSPNHYTVYSPKDGRVLFEKDGRETSEVITGGSGKVLSKRENKE